MVGRIFFSLFFHKLSITFVLHAIFFFRQALAGNFFSKLPPPPPPSRVNWSAPYCSLFLHINLCFTQFFVQMNYFELFLSAHFLFLEILNVNLTFAVCRIREAKKRPGFAWKTANRKTSGVQSWDRVCSLQFTCEQQEGL